MISTLCVLALLFSSKFQHLDPLIWRIIYAPKELLFRQRRTAIDEYMFFFFLVFCYVEKRDTIKFSMEFSFQLRNNPTFDDFRVNSIRGTHYNTSCAVVMFAVTTA